MVGKRIRRVSRGYHYFFVKPRQNGDVEKAVERLMEIDGVKEVSVTDGEYGFLVKTHADSKKSGNVLDRIGKATGGRAVKAVCHCQYVKADV